MLTESRLLRHKYPIRFEVPKNKKCYHIYTDGSYLKGAKSACWGFVVYLKTGTIMEEVFYSSGICSWPSVSKHIDGEVEAVVQAVGWLKNDYAIIYHDLKLIGQWATRSYETKSLISKYLMLSITPRLKRMKFSWVKGHSGNPGNDRADKLAKDKSKFYLKKIKSANSGNKGYIGRVK